MTGQERKNQGANRDGAALAPNGIGLAESDIARDLPGFMSLGKGSCAVVVLHEWLGNHENFVPIVPYLDERRFTYLFPDLRGYGLSKNLTGRYTAEEASNDVLRLADRRGYRRFHIAGHSMSAMIAQKIASNARERVRSMTAITPVSASGFRVDDATRRRMEAVITDDKAARDATAARTANRYGDSWLERKVGMARAAATKDAMLGYLSMFTGTDFADEVRGLELPVLAIVGEHDIPAYREDAVKANFEGLYPNFRMTVSREAGHYPMLETPVLLASVLEKFISETEAA